jgi:pyruvate kinase
VAILQDLSGIKIRTGAIAQGTITLQSGAQFTLTNRPVPGDEHTVSITYPDLPTTVQPGDTLLLSDGALELEVCETTAHDIICRVIIGGPLSANKGINLPTRSITAPGLTEKDKQDLQFGIQHAVDYVALSFVRTASDVLEAKRFIQEQGSTIPVIAKIEKHEALKHIDDIIPVVDGVMVARGDLGVEIPLQKVPLIQKMLIAKSNQAGKPVITATHMLRSMVDNPRPTRAEVADVANAILDGTDAVMLSEETAIGNYPVEAVAMMAQITEDAEAGFAFASWRQRRQTEGVKTSPEAVAHAACRLAEDIQAKAIITCTHSGSTARLVAKHRPRHPILATTPQEKTYCRLALVWGVIPLYTTLSQHTDAMIAKAFQAVLRSGYVQRGDIVVITAGVPVGVPGNTNLLKVEELLPSQQE